MFHATSFSALSMPCAEHATDEANLQAQLHVPTTSRARDPVLQPPVCRGLSVACAPSPGFASQPSCRLQAPFTGRFPGLCKTSAPQPRAPSTVSQAPVIRPLSQLFADHRRSSPFVQNLVSTHNGNSTPSQSLAPLGSVHPEITPPRISTNSATRPLALFRNTHLFMLIFHGP